MESDVRDDARREPAPSGARESPYAARKVIARKDARRLARDLLGMTQEELSRAFSKSPMKRAKLPGLQRNAAVVLGIVGTVEDAGLLARALDDLEPLAREHTAWALARIDARAVRPLAGEHRTARDDGVVDHGGNADVGDGHERRDGDE